MLLDTAWPTQHCDLIPNSTTAPTKLYINAPPAYCIYSYIWLWPTAPPSWDPRSLHHLTTEPQLNPRLTQKLKTKLWTFGHYRERREHQLTGRKFRSCRGRRSSRIRWPPSECGVPISSGASGRSSIRSIGPPSSPTTSWPTSPLSRMSPPGTRTGRGSWAWCASTSTPWRRVAIPPAAPSATVWTPSCRDSIAPSPSPCQFAGRPTATRGRARWSPSTPTRGASSYSPNR